MSKGRKFEVDDKYRPQVHIRQVKDGVPIIIYVSGRTFRLVEPQTYVDKVTEDDNKQR